MPEEKKEDDKAVTTPNTGQVDDGPDSIITSKQLERLLQGLPDSTKGEAKSEEEETLPVEKKETQEEEEKKPGEWETLIKELGFKDQDAVAHSYKEIQRRATRAEEENKALREKLSMAVNPSQQQAPKTMTMDEFQELMTEKPLEALDLHYRQRSKDLEQRLRQVETALYFQSVQSKHPDFDINAHEEEIVEIYKKYPGLYNDLTGFELAVELVKKREQEALAKKQIEEAKNLGRLEAEEAITAKEKAAGIIGRQSIRALPDVSKMTAAELEQLLPKA